MPYENKSLFLDENTLSLLRRIKFDRALHGLNQTQLAHLLGIKDYRSISRYERGKRIPNLGNFFKLAEIFNWNILDNPNYIFYSGFLCSDELKGFKRRFHFSNYELANIIGADESTVSFLFSNSPQATPDAFGKILNVFEDEERREKIRDEILAQPRRKKKRR